MAQFFFTRFPPTKHNTTINNRIQLTTSEYNSEAVVSFYLTIRSSQIVLTNHV
jgi:hypothetical protein